MYVYRKIADLYVVGYYRPDGQWEPESDQTDREQAAARVAYLNGAKGYHKLAQIQQALEILLLSHAWYTAREYKRDPAYNNQGPGYREEEQALRVYARVFGEDDYKALLRRWPRKEEIDGGR